MINKDVLKKINIKHMCLETGLSYDIVKNYKQGRKKDLDSTYKTTIETYIKEIIKQ
jgi:hypothetical protein